jgi:hypothetical protein
LVTSQKIDPNKTLTHDDLRIQIFQKEREKERERDVVNDKANFAWQWVQVPTQQ